MLVQSTVRVHLLVLCGLLAFVGCGGSESTVNIVGKGTITFKGAPLAKASIQFIPEGTGMGLVAISDDQGQFSIIQPSAGDAPSGNYKVAVSKSEIVGADNSYSDVNSPNYGKEPPESAKGTLKHLIPEKYGDPKTSGLTATLGGGDITLALTE